MNTYTIRLTFLGKNVTCKVKANTAKEAKDKVISQIVFTQITCEKPPRDDDRIIDFFENLFI